MILNMRIKIYIYNVNHVIYGNLILFEYEN